MSFLPTHFHPALLCLHAHFQYSTCLPHVTSHLPCPLAASHFTCVTCHLPFHLSPIIPYSLFLTLFTPFVSPLVSCMLASPLSSHPLLPLHFRRDCNAKMSYQLLYPDQTDPKLIKVGMDGTIHTTSISGHAVVVVTAFESELDYNQSVVVHIEVCPVASLALTPPPFLPQAMPSSQYYSFTLGYSADFTINLHDTKGRMFSRTAISIKYKLNR